ncbi:MAG: MFS transporter [Anaerolineaceae bacterium]|nr:MFS transporter [Anaerolineaceae bacterium]
MKKMRPHQTTPVKLLKNALNFLGLKKNILALLTMVILLGMGEKMAERFLPLYLAALGGGVFSIGLLNGMDNFLSALYSYLGGYISSRLGYKRALMLFNWVAMLGFLIVIIFPYWQAVIIGAVFFLSWTAISFPATMDMVSQVLPKNKHTMGVSMHSLVRRIPMAAGPVLGGMMIALFGEIDGIRLTFGVALVLGALSLVFQQVMIDEGHRQMDPAKKNPFREFKFISPALRTLLLSDILIRFCEQIPYAFVVIWCVKLNGITPLQFGLLTTIEMVTAMLIYIPVAYLADRGTKKPFIAVSFGFFTLFPIVLLFARTFWLMVIAFIIRGLKEFGEPTRKSLIMDLAPQGRKASTFGVYYLFRDIIVSMAAFGGALLWDASMPTRVLDALGVGKNISNWFALVASPEANFLTASFFGIVGTLVFIKFGRERKPGQISKSEKRII